jgi:hypothetical protein
MDRNGRKVQTSQHNRQSLSFVHCESENWYKEAKCLARGGRSVKPEIMVVQEYMQSVLNAATTQLAVQTASMNTSTLLSDLV